MNTYRAGIDIGSTTVKLVLLDENGKILFGHDSLEPVGGAAMGGQVVRPYEIAKSACMRADRDGSLCGFHNN